MLWGPRRRRCRALDTLPADGAPDEHGLRRSVGVPALFATAYGNVGSSIYYALGLVAAHALGLTPLVFVFAGGLFALTAKTYAEGASMFPEAGGSSSFARHAFNDVVSFFAGWALSLDYILTIAISAFFVPHYLERVPGPARAQAQPRRHHRRAGRGRAARRAEHPRPGRVGEAELRPRGRRPRHAGAARRARARCWCSTRSLLIDQVHLGAAPTLERTDLRAVARDARLHRHRDGLEHGRGGQGPGHEVPQGGQPRADRRARRLRGHLGGRALGAAGRAPRRRLQPGATDASITRHATALGGFFENDPVLGIIARLGPARDGAHLAEDYVGMLAATILFIATNAGMIGISRLSWSLAEHRQLPGDLLAAAPELPHAVVHDRLLLGLAGC